MTELKARTKYEGEEGFYEIQIKLEEQSGWGCKVHRGDGRCERRALLSVY